MLNSRLFGFLLGLVNGIPQKSWSIDHAFHHRNNGNWEIYKSPIDVLSLEDYKSLSKRGKYLYKKSRNWIMLFPGGFYYLVLKPRLGLIIIIFNFKFFRPFPPWQHIKLLSNNTKCCIVFNPRIPTDPFIKINFPFFRL